MDIKDCFVSRFPAGVLLEADFSQLEVIALATLSKDKTLITDIALGLDMHTKRAAELFGLPESEVTPEQRRLAKQLSFQLQYGAGSKSMAETNGILEEYAKRFIKLYYERYPEVAQWQSKLYNEVEEGRKPAGTHTKKGVPRGVSLYKSPTGRVYTFHEYDAPDWAPAGTTSFSPTEVKNYPVQGFATADIMAMFRALVYRRLDLSKRHRICTVINTVHDSIMFDCPNDSAAAYVARVLERIAKDLPEHIKRCWGIDCPLPFPIECKIGSNWGNMTKFDYHTY